MLKRLLIAAATLPLIGVSAGAQDISAEQKSCFENAFKLAQSAGGKSLADGVLASIEAKIEKLEGMCEAENFAGAATAATEIETSINGG